MKLGPTRKHDVVIVGGGPAGAATALYLLGLGVEPVILERDRFPRYHIGESLTGEVGLSLRELGLERDLVAARWPVKYGVTVYGPGGKNAFWVPVMKRDSTRKLSPASTWQVRRSDFDQLLLKTAIERGAELIPCAAITPLAGDDRVGGVRVRTPQGLTQDLQAHVVIDASGQATFLASNGAPTGAKERGTYDKQLAIFSQVVGGIRDPGETAGNTLIFYGQKNHWAWFIPLDDEVVSVGVVVPGEYFTAQKLSRRDFLQRELRTLNPELSRRLPDLTFVEDVHSASNYSYHIKRFTGKGFLCVGDSHRFIDPIFSFGVNFAVKEAQFAADTILEYLGGETEDANQFAAYEARSERGQDIIQDLVDVFWDHPLPFLILVHHQHRDGMIDLFAGRIFEDDVAESETVHALRRCLNKSAASGCERPQGPRHA